MSRTLYSRQIFALSDFFSSNIISRGLGGRNFSARTTSVRLPESVQIEYTKKAEVSDGYFPIFNPQTLKSEALQLEELLFRNARQGCEDSDSLLKAADNFLTTKCNTIFIANAVPSQSKHKKFFVNLDYIKSDGEIDYVYKRNTIIENFPNLHFLTNYLYLCGVEPYLRNFGIGSARPVPVCVLVTKIHQQPKHTDGVFLEKEVSALAMTAIESSGQVATFIIDLQDILQNLSHESIQTLLDTDFYRNDLCSLESNPVRILQFDENGKIGIKYNKNLCCADENKDAQKAIQELGAVMTKLYETKMQKFYLKKGESLIIDNRQLVHGRYGAECNPSTVAARTLGVLVGSKLEQREI